MISVDEAKEAVAKNIPFLNRKKTIPVTGALGYLTAQDIYAPLDLPPFNQSNVDGYAIRFSEKGKDTFTIKDELQAGDVFKGTLQKGEAVRVFTGAIVPIDADAVVMQENVEVTKKHLTIKSTVVKPGDYIRKQGSQVTKDVLAIQEKTWLTPGAIGFLCAMGLKKVAVYDKPTISLVVTGNELQHIGETLKQGKVYDSNSYTLIAAAESIGLKITNSSLVKDSKTALVKVLRSQLGKADVLLVSGGVSVGKYDLVEEALNELGATAIFHNVAQRPGKPLYFGKFKNTFIFGVPGNPSSALTCFYEYVFPALNILRGKSDVFLKTANYKLLTDFKTVPHLSYFVRGKLNADGVQPLEGFESYKMKAFADADCLIYLPKGRDLWQSGEPVEVHLLF